MNLIKSILQALGKLLQIYPNPIDLSEINKRYKNKYESDEEALQSDWDVGTR